MAEKYVVDFLNGKNVWGHVKSLNGSEVFDLYKEIQETIISKKLRPIVRTFYKRNAFQLPNDSSVRISLDTNLAMIKECYDEELENDNRPLTRWRREDINCEWPFLVLEKHEIVRFPHAILEIKTQGVDESKPEWIEELISSSYVEHVHKFSKFMHGCAVLFPKISYIPYWLPQMKSDIRKDPFHDLKPTKRIERNEIIDFPGEPEFATSEELSPVQNHGKKIAVPIRVEPKVFFANERTFLKWIQFAIFLGGIGTALLGLGSEKSIFCGIALIIVSIIFSFYAIWLFMWRNEKIRIRDSKPYDDLYGPTILVFVFLVAMLLNVIFKFPSNPNLNDENLDKNF